jgi:hypothetical protein
MQKKLIVWILLASFLAGCAPTQAAVDIQGAVNTAVAQTMEAQRHVAEMVAETVAAQLPAASPTMDFTPTSAATFSAIIIPTDTPIPALPPVEEPTDTPSPAAEQPLYACDVFTQAPDYQETFKAGTKFDIKWMIVNTGTRAWPAGTDVKYSDGWQMTGVKSVEIPVVMNPQDRYTITLDAVAPSKTGHQYMTWAVGGQLCFPSIIINVK